MTLLSKAMAAASFKGSKYASHEYSELAMAWLEGRITDTQLAAALGKTLSNSRYAIATIIRGCVQSGILSIGLSKKKESGGRK